MTRGCKSYVTVNVDSLLTTVVSSLVNLSFLQKRTWVTHILQNSVCTVKNFTVERFFVVDVADVANAIAIGQNKWSNESFLTAVDCFDSCWCKHHLITNLTIGTDQLNRTVVVLMEPRKKWWIIPLPIIKIPLDVKAINYTLIKD
jgi:hypothetical protein